MNTPASTTEVWNPYAGHSGQWIPQPSREQRLAEFEAAIATGPAERAWRRNGGE